MTTRASSRHTVLPPEDLEQMLDLSHFLAQHSEPAGLVGPDGQCVPLPLEAYTVLREIVDAMRQGKAITVVPVDKTLTTQEAANFLGISRPTLVKILESGEIDFTYTTGGRHRRVRLQDLVDYQEKKRRASRSALDDMTAEAAAEGLYEADASLYVEALAAARMRPPVTS
ncbi:helix-turn-helix domain-containing protein [Helcobacillus massiliensis]|uniref:helix-turn-helix domain-containing protein n=1 Tax=Helcobacillus massiliensis TaxID=521392 RepID=UPI002552614C|nr:helix-turn-helix domain-containing protein [Helcobacillus massiliensis]MDK7741346.1 helix-turn-helix domain-containing protein [Helcobacillus massiliensis]WOO92803.1 helix-turn-helix domain-containing protein [Helcobacillus massiliensis]